MIFVLGILHLNMIKCALHLKYNIKTKMLKIKNTNAMIFTSLKRLKMVLIKNTKATIFTSSKRKENNNPKKLSY